MISIVTSRLYLVDGMSQIYRSFYAIRGLSDQTGRPTNAVFGFTKMLRKLIDEENPDFLGVAIDLPGPTIRHQKFAEYKAKRKPTPPELLDQIPLVLDVCQVLRIPVFSLKGYEADDVIGTLSKKAVSAGLEVVIVSIDKDMFQLVSGQISILDTRQMKRLGPSEIFSKIGVQPHQVVDLLSLVGDSSDNVPGAPGIGSKGAQKLINKYGNLHKLLLRRSEISNRTYRSSLENHEDQILQSQELVTIYQDLPIPLDLEKLRLTKPDGKSARKLFSKLNFVSIINEFLPTKNDEDVDYKKIECFSELESLKEEILEARISLFPLFERSSNGIYNLCGLGVSTAPKTGFSVEEDLLTNQTNLVFKLLCQAREWITHDLKPLLAWLESQEIQAPQRLSDTMLTFYLISPHQKDFTLEKACLQYLHYQFSDTETQKSLLEDFNNRALAERADLILKLACKLDPLLVDKGLKTIQENIEIPLIEVLIAMEKSGILVDSDFLDKMSGQVNLKIEESITQIHKLAGEKFNINSPRQLASILFEKLKLPVVKRTRKAGHYATGVDVLEKLAVDHEIATHILKYREVSKLKNTYLDALPRLINEDTGRVHTSFNQMVTATGRLSSSRPNLQNIPVRTQLGRSIRKAFMAPSGFSILTADYSQLELRVMAHLSRDKALLQAFLNEEDIHSQTALEVFGSKAEVDPEMYRRKAKVINFGVMYGLSAFGLAKTLETSRAEAQIFIDRYFERYKGVQHWIESTLAQARDSGYVRTLFGRIRPIPEINNPNHNLRNFGERSAVNAPIQGTAADLIKMAMIDVHRTLKAKCYRSSLLLQVHDELVLEVSKDEMGPIKELVHRCMESVADLDVPLKVDIGIGESWYKAK